MIRTPFLILVLGFLMTLSWYIGITKAMHSLALSSSSVGLIQDFEISPATAVTTFPVQQKNTIRSDAGPDGDDPLRTSNYNFTVAICLIVNDGEQYFQEWVDYHLLVMQFDAIYVYDNSNNFDLHRWYDNTRKHPIYRHVHIEHRPGPGQSKTGKKTDRYLQNNVYDECIQKYGKDTNGPQHDYL